MSIGAGKTEDLRNLGCNNKARQSAAPIKKYIQRLIKDSISESSKHGFVKLNRALSASVNLRKPCDKVTELHCSQL